MFANDPKFQFVKSSIADTQAFGPLSKHLRWKELVKSTQEFLFCLSRGFVRICRHDGTSSAVISQLQVAWGVGCALSFVSQSSYYTVRIQLKIVVVPISLGRLIKIIEYSLMTLLIIFHLTMLTKVLRLIEGSRSLSHNESSTDRYEGYSLPRNSGAYLYQVDMYY